MITLGYIKFYWFIQKSTELNSDEKMMLNTLLSFDKANRDVLNSDDALGKLLGMPVDDVNAAKDHLLRLRLIETSAGRTYSGASCSYLKISRERFNEFFLIDYFKDVLSVG